MQRQGWLTAAVAAVVVGAGVSLTRVFTEGSWRPETLLAMALALVIAAGAHRLGIPSIISALFSVAGLFVFTYITHLTAGPLIPGAEQMRALYDIARDGFIQLQEQPAPTAPLDGLRLLVTTGVWAVTHLTYEILLRARRALLALVPPAVLWLVPLAVPLPPSRTWPTALPFLAAAALVLLLESDATPSGWTREDDRPPLSTGMALGSAALAVAAILPGILPGYNAEPWVDLTGSNDPRGYQPIVDVGDRLKLPDPRDVMQVVSDRPVYLRLAALETFDGTTWRLGPAGVSSYRPDPDDLFSTDGRLPYETDIAITDRVTASIEVLDLENIYVPTPYQVERIDGPDGMFYSRVGGFIATGDLSDNEISGDLRVGVRPGFKYEVEAVIPSPSYEDLAALGDIQTDPGDATIALPGPYDRMRDLTNQIYADAAATTTIDKALAVQSYFISDTSPFTYSTDVPTLRGDQALQRFLFDTQSGYCEYYATAMAVMLRATGIPARVSVGFLPGRQIDPPFDDERNADPDIERTFVVGTGDAHAWVEVLFPGYGWIRMDPTPRSDGATMVPTVNNLDPLVTQQQRSNADFRDLIDGLEGDDPAPDPLDDLPPREPDQTGDLGGGTANDGNQRNLPLILAVSALMLAAGTVVALRRRRPAGDSTREVREDVIAAQRALLSRARQLGVGRQPSETLSDTVKRWITDGRVSADSVGALVPLAQAAAFGGDLPDNAGAEAWSSVDAITRELQESVGRTDRALAPVRVPYEATRAAANRTLTRVRRTLRK